MNSRTTDPSRAVENLPVPMANADGQRYWASARDGKLSLQRCALCQTFRFPPGYSCRKCGSTDAEWVSVSGRGTIYSFTIVRRGPTPEFASITPYILALVELDEGPRILSHLVEDELEQIAIGDRVEVVFKERRDGVKIPEFKREY